MRGNGILTKNDRIKLRRFRAKLLAWGMPEEDAKRCFNQARERMQEKRLGYLELDAPICTLGVYVKWLRQQPDVHKQGATILQFGDDYTAPNDTAYKPTHVDSTLKGTGRATGQTAKAVKRGKTITRYKYGEGK